MTAALAAGGRSYPDGAFKRSGVQAGALAMLALNCVMVPGTVSSMTLRLCLFSALAGGALGFFAITLG